MSSVKLFLHAFLKYVFIIIILFWGCSYNKSNNGIYDAVPINAAIIIKINKPLQFVEDLLLNNKFYDELKLCKDFNVHTNFLSDLYEKIDNEREMKKYFDDSKIVISTHLIDKNTTESLYTITLPINSNNKIESFSTFFKNKNLTKDKIYENKQIFKITWGNKKNVYCTEHNNLVIASKNIFLIEDALRQLKSDNKINNTPGFKSVDKTADKNELMNIYLNYEYFPKILSHYFNCNSTFAYNQNLASWSEFDLDMNSESFLLNGYTFPHKLGSDYFSILTDQSSSKSQIENVIPSSTTNFFRFYISDVEEFKYRYFSYLKKNKNMGSISQIISDFDDLDINIEDLYYKIFNSEIAFINTRINNGVTFTILNTIGKSKTLKIYTNIVKQYCEEKNIDDSKLHLKYQIDDQTYQDVYKLPFKNFTGKLFGNIQNDEKNKFYTFFDNYIIFGPDVNSLMKLIKENIRQKNLANNRSYQEFKDNTPSNACFYFYINLPYATKDIHSKLSYKYKSLLENNISLIRKIKGLAIQYTPQNDIVYGNIYFQYQENIQKEKNTLWEAFINKKLIIKPQFVLNHNTRNYEFMVQDEEFNLFLINSAGRIIWQKKLSSKILSKIHQVDFYNNKKLQYLFNTEDKVFLLDRNNNYVENFPINLSHKATTGLSIFDYDKDRNYRIFIPCEDKRIRLYNLNGKLVSGWTQRKFETTIQKPIKWTRIRNKDYILVADKNRIYILNRKGDERVKIENNFSIAKNSNLFLEYDYKNANYNIVSTDINGTIKKVSFEGKIKASRKNNTSKDHHFILYDIDSNGSKERIIVDKNKLLVYNENNVIIFEYSFKNKITVAPNVFKFSSKNIMIGVTDVIDEKIYLINNIGELNNNFPLTGTTEFSIGYTSKDKSHFNLIVGNSDNFLLNYKITID